MLISRGMRANATYRSSIGAADHSRLREKQLHPLLDALKIPRGGFHSLRHGAASALLAAGATPAVVQRQLRHSDARITLGIYATSLAMSSAVLCKVVRQGWCTRAGRPRFVRKLGFVRKFGCKLLKTKLVW